MRTSWDIAIVGAGPAGAASAIEAARAGFKVVVIDVANFPRQKVCGEHLSASAWRRLDELGIDDLRSLSVPLPTMQLTATDSCLVHMEFEDDRSIPRSLSRHALDARLIEEARRAGATILSGRRVLRVIATNGRATALECAGSNTHEPGELLTARLIIAADGRRSVVVRDTGRTIRKDIGLLGFKRHVHYTGGAAHQTISMHALPGGYLGVCPTETGDLNVCGVMPRKLLKEARGDLVAALSDWLTSRPALRTLVLADGEGPWMSMPDVSLQSSQPTTTGVLYVGDAQGTIEPLTGQGMSMALASAQMFGDWIRNNGIDNFDDDAQREYDQSWHSKFRRPIRAATWFGRLLRRPALLRAILQTGCPLPRFTTSLLRHAHARTLT